MTCRLQLSDKASNRSTPGTIRAGSSVEWVSRRETQGLKGRLLVRMLRLAGRQTLSGSLRRTLALIEKAS